MSPTAAGLIERLRRGVVLLDGAMGTALMKQGLPAGKPGETWNLERPEAVQQIHAGHAAAGSEVIQTNTFGASPLRLRTHGLEDRFEAINVAAVKLAREAAGADRLVAGNIGPAGLFLPPLGEAEPEALEAGYAAQAEVLARAGVDYISIETQLDLQEALLALGGARKGAPGLPVSVCMIFEKKKKGFFSPMGNRPADSMRALAAAGADLVGANCSMGSAEMLEMVDELLAGSPVPVAVKPNAGLPEMEGGIMIYRQPPEEFAEHVVEMAKRGARAVGGCCGTDDRFIAALRKGLTSLREERP